MDIKELFAEVARIESSDLHLVAGFPPMIRLNKQLVPMPNMPILTADDIQNLINSTLTNEQRELLLTNRELDYSVAAEASRFRVNVYYQKSTPAAAFRLIPNRIKAIDALGLPHICNELVNIRQGLVLVTGPTGHGKSTTLAAMINVINQTKPRHIVTIEDPIEYIYPRGLSIVSQREMHGDTHSWSIALRSVLREDPDVVLVGEMRDFETIQAAITVAETGHLVFATLHTNSAAQTIDRIVDVFPQTQQSQIRLQLSSTLEAIIAQRLVPSLAGGLTPIAEILVATPAVRTVVREGKTHLLDNIIQTSAEFGMLTLEAALAAAAKDSRISVETATAYALRPDDLARMLRI